MDYKTTLNLPSTGFEMRASLAEKEPACLARWQRQDLWQRIERARQGAPRFVLHDGPPYANGTLHHGHILNKILKDIVVKDRTLAGFSVPYVPGWDCHGLPIEVQVDKELGSRKSGMSRTQVRQACRAYAQRFVDLQRASFQRLGVLGRWQTPYLTMDPAYEGTTLRMFAELVRQRLVYKGLRPVNWCMVHQTALAEAEVEYDSAPAPSAYVAFEVSAGAARLGLPEVDLVIWTTTPWTLPANQAIAVHPDLQYIAYPVGGRLRLVSERLAPAFLAAIGAEAMVPSQVAGRWSGRELTSLRYRHVFLDREGPVVTAKHVTDDSGTGCVHTAPGHGAEDFEVGREYGLPTMSPVDGRGYLLEAAGRFAGLHVGAANREILHHLQAQGSLLGPVDARLEHRTAHCWRCHKPIITRATEQWFVAMDRPFAEGPSLRSRALAALDGVCWIPQWGIERMRGMLTSRPDWCLSRQRSWGVPIAVVYCEGCRTAVLDPALIDRVAARFDEHGADIWYERTVAELLGALRCPQCGGQDFRKEEDILDVWFDSGVSFAAVIEAAGLSRAEGPPADLYLEGSDQHRGWFHASLLCSLATRQQAPFCAVLTHGFVVDGAGKKISKSKGNYLDPFVAIERDGAELLRLWVASEDYRDDIRLSQEILTRMADAYRKVRNTMRFALGNLAGFVPPHDCVEATQLHDIDRYALALGARMVEKIRHGYATYAFHTVMQTLIEWCSSDLSAFYFDVLKDRLYASARADVARRSAQTALFILARDLCRVAAPIFCFTSEEAWGHIPRLADDPDSVHLAAYPGVDEPSHIDELRLAVRDDGEALCAAYADVRELRKRVNTALEQARRDKRIGSSVEARVQLLLGPDERAGLARWSNTVLAELFIVSEVETVSAASGVAVVVERAAGEKCARCWLYRRDIGSASDHPQLCGRCASAVVSYA